MKQAKRAGAPDLSDLLPETPANPNAAVALLPLDSVATTREIHGYVTTVHESSAMIVLSKSSYDAGAVEQQQRINVADGLFASSPVAISAAQAVKRTGGVRSELAAAKSRMAASREEYERLLLAGDKGTEAAESKAAIDKNDVEVIGNRLAIFEANERAKCVDADAEQLRQRQAALADWRAEVDAKLLALHRRIAESVAPLIAEMVMLDAMASIAGTAKP